MSHEFHRALIGHHLKHLFRDLRGVMEEDALVHTGHAFDMAREHINVMADHNDRHRLVEFPQKRIKIGLTFCIHARSWLVEEEEYEDTQSGEVMGMTVRFYPGDTFEPGMSAMAGMSVWVFPASSPLDTEADLSDLITTFVESSGQQLVHGPTGVEIGDHRGVQAIVCEGDPDQATWGATKP